jgi:peptidyl-Lys metalloendopeptidase
MRWLLALVVAVAMAGPASARVFEGCTPGEAKVAGAAVDGARELALRAAAAVGDTRHFGQWFGLFSAQHGEDVRAGLKAIHGALAADDLRVACLRRRDPSCEAGTFAFVLFQRPGAIHLCPPFFGMPVMADALAGRAPIYNGTREGTIIHEMSHFPSTAGTGDDCYGREECRDLAKRDPGAAVGTADSFQYFAEDVMLAHWLSQQ